jgi:hypothetical protein
MMTLKGLLPGGYSTHVPTRPPEMKESQHQVACSLWFELRKRLPVSNM